MIAEPEGGDDLIIIELCDDLSWRCFRRDGSQVGMFSSLSKWEALEKAKPNYPPGTKHRFVMTTERYYALYDLPKP